MLASAGSKQRVLAYDVVQAMWCKLRGAIYVVQLMWCKPCGAVCVMQLVWRNLFSALRPV
eukprot:2674545-Pyramimonas_sp.AAC.1